MMQSRKIAKWPNINMDRDRQISSDQAHKSNKPPYKVSDRSLGLKPFSSGDSDHEEDLTDRFVNYVHQDDNAEP